MLDFKTYYNEVVTVDYKDSYTLSLDTPCNYFRITNIDGEQKVFFSTTGQPSEIKYDGYIYPNNSRLHVDVFKKSSITFYNPSTLPVTLNVIAFVHDFSPEALSIVLNGLLNEQTISTISEINENVSLMQGNTSALPLMKTDLTSLQRNLHFLSLSLAGTPIAGDEYYPSPTVYEMITAIHDKFMDLVIPVSKTLITKFYDTLGIPPDGEEVILLSGRIKEISFISNEGLNPVTIGIYSDNTTITDTFTIGVHENFSNIPIDAFKIGIVSIPDTSGSYCRVIIKYEGA